MICDLLFPVCQTVNSSIDIKMQLLKIIKFKKKSNFISLQKKELSEFNLNLSACG